MAELIDKEKVRACVRKRLESNPKYIDARREMLRLTNKGKVVQAIAAGKKMKAIEDEELEKYSNELNSQYFSIKEVREALDEKNRKKFIMTMDAITFLIDAVDTCIRELDETMATLGGTLKIEVFGPFKALGEEAKRVLNRSHFESMQNEELYADYMDSIERYIFMRARTFREKDEALARKISKEKKDEKNK